jgi:predicted dehydrogenase
VRVAIIGAGLQGARRAAAVRAAGGAQVTTVVDADLGRARRLGEVYGATHLDSWEKALARDEADAVVVCTPPSMHAAIGISAAQQGKHILCEKPLARTIPEAQRMVTAARNNGVVLKCGFNLRHHPGIVQAKNWVDEGRLGSLKFLRCRYGVGGREGYDSDWRVDPEVSGGGELVDQGTHIVDLARWFLGDFERGFSYSESYFWGKAPVEDNAFCLLRTSSGQVASFHVSWTQWRPLFSLEVFGQDGYVRVEGLGGAYGVETVSLGLRDFNAPFKEETIEFRGADRSWHAEWREFAQAIEEGREPLGNGSDGLKALEMVTALYRGARDGRQVVFGHEVQEERG